MFIVAWGVDGSEGQTLTAQRVHMFRKGEMSENGKPHKYLQNSILNIKIQQYLLIFSH